MVAGRYFVAFLLAAACNGTVETGSSPAASQSGGAPPDGGDASLAGRALDASSGAGRVADGGYRDPTPPAPVADAAPAVPRIPGVDVTRRPGPYREIAGGRTHTCAIRHDGTVDCWGGGVAVEPCPDPTSLFFCNPPHGSTCATYYKGCESALPPPGQFSKLALGRFHSCGLRTDGTVACWGTGPGVGPYRCTATPEGGSPCPAEGTADGGLLEQADGGNSGGPKRFIDIDAFWDGTCAVRTTGAIECWGDLESVPVPREGRFAKVAVNDAQVCALTREGSASCWGTKYGRELPAAPPGPFVSIILTGDACALSEDHWLRCWSAYTPSELPGEWVMSPDGQFSYLAGGPSRSCALDSEGGHACWGDPDFLAASEPWPDEVFEQLALSWKYTCGLLEDGSVLCWRRVAQR